MNYIALAHQTVDDIVLWVRGPYGTPEGAVNAALDHAKQRDPQLDMDEAALLMEANHWYVLRMKDDPDHTYYEIMQISTHKWERRGT